jgi:hypothetical protein
MSTTGYAAQRHEVDLAALQEAIDAFPTEGGFYLLWRANCITDIKALPVSEDVAEWEEGRLFGPQGELRWRKGADRRWNLLYLYEEGSAPLPGFERGEHYEVVFPDEGRRERVGQYLWGARAVGSTEHWVETRIPRELRYPRDLAVLPREVSREFAWIRYCEYRTPEGAVQFVRLMGRV